MSVQAKYWAVIPAAGTGSRMQSDVPKQYLQLNGKCVLEHTLERFCYHPRIEGIVVALSENDPYWNKLALSGHEKVMSTPGGAERYHSVLNGLKYLKTYASPDDWVLVHDAARPCLRHQDIDQLIQKLTEHPVGGLLALPVRDTMKRTDEVRGITETVNREDLWHALTPQMFRLEILEAAIEAAISGGQTITDEAQAIELYGQRPQLIQGYPDNIKITHQSDLPLAELFLSEQEGNE